MNDLEQYWLHLFDNKPPHPFNLLSEQKRNELSNTLGYAKFKLGKRLDELWTSITGKP